MNSFISLSIDYNRLIVIAWTILNGAEMETSLPQDGTANRMPPTSYARRKPNKTLKTLSVLWPMLGEGMYSKDLNNLYYRVDIKLT